MMNISKMQQTSRLHRTHCKVHNASREIGQSHTFNITVQGHAAKYREEYRMHNTIQQKILGYIANTHPEHKDNTTNYKNNTTNNTYKDNKYIHIHTADTEEKIFSR